MKSRQLFAATSLGALSALALPAASMVVPTATAAANPPHWAPAHGHRAKMQHVRYDRDGRYREPRRLSRNDRVWRGRDGRYHCRRDNGTTGLIIGGAIGSEVMTLARAIQESVYGRFGIRLEPEPVVV